MKGERGEVAASVPEHPDTRGRTSNRGCLWPYRSQQQKCVSWNDYEASSRRECRSNGEKDGERHREVFYYYLAAVPSVGIDPCADFLVLILECILKTCTPTELPNEKRATRRDQNKVVMAAPSPNKEVNSNVPLNAILRPSRSEPG